MDHNFKDILHNVNLTEGQISTILFCLEGYVAGLDDVVTQNENDKELIKDVDAIFQELEGSVDRFYDNLEKIQKQQPVAEWTD